MEDEAPSASALKSRRYRERLKREEPEKYQERLRKSREWLANKRATDPEWTDVQNKRVRWSVNARYGNYKRDAKKRGIMWVLDKEDCETLFIENCHYCHRTVDEIGSLMGIDRKDSDYDYTVDNILPCCETCNFAKNDSSYEDYCLYLKTLVRNRKDLL